MRKLCLSGFHLVVLFCCLVALPFAIYDYLSTKTNDNMLQRSSPIWQFFNRECLLCQKRPKDREEIHQICQNMSLSIIQETIKTWSKDTSTSPSPSPSSWTTSQWFENEFYQNIRQWVCSGHLVIVKACLPGRLQQCVLHLCGMCTMQQYEENHEPTTIVRVGTTHSASWLFMHIRLSGESLTICEKTVPWQPLWCCEMTKVSVPRQGSNDRWKTSGTSCASHFSDTNRNRPQHSVEINSLMNGTRRLMFIRLIILDYSFTDEEVLSEGFISGGSYVWRGFCPRGFCPGRGFCPRGFCLGGFVCAPWWSTSIQCNVILFLSAWCKHLA